MNLHLTRYSSGDDSSLGILHIVDDAKRTFFCYTLEDEYREKKLAGATRIPAGEYEIKLREAGGMNESYKKKYPNHKGMLWLQNVENFRWIYIHTGNSHRHTEGCILVGETVVSYPTSGGSLRDSTAAYTRLYDKLLPHLINDGSVKIRINDFDTPRTQK